MAGQCCDTCVYSVFDPQLWRRALWMREPLVPRCANHPQWPGQMHDVPGVACPNYRRKPILPSGDGVRLIPLGDGFYAYVDAADYEWLSKYTWHLQNGYAARYENHKRIFMHRQIMEPPAHRFVDHFDANRANNCRLNLRVCTAAENQHSRRKRLDSRSPFKGVEYHKQSGKWRAKCQYEGRIYRLGLFDDPAEAARAYDRKAVELFREYARLNFPEEWPPERRQEIYAQHPRRGESSFARKSVALKKPNGKKAGSKDGKTAPRAKPRTVRTKDEPKATRRKTEGRKRRHSTKIINGKSSIINSEGTPGRRDRKHTTKKATRKGPRAAHA